jgi:acetyl esterase/lipase
MSDLRYDPEFWEVLKAMPAAGTPQPVVRDAMAFRKAHESMLDVALKNMPRCEDVSETRYEVTSLDGTRFAVSRFALSSSAGATSPQPAAIYIHGGGLVAGTVQIFRPIIESLVTASGVPMFGVEYRRAPEDPFPAAVEDVLATIRWMQANAAELNLDPARIALFGISAGGCLAAGATLMARDQGLDPPLARLILHYPMLDDRTTIEPEHPLNKFLIWTGDENDMSWQAYLGGRDRQQRGDDDDVSIYASPSRAEDLSGLPPTYVGVGGLDLFAAETTAFAARLARAGNNLELHVWPGLPHAFDSVAPHIRAAREATANSIRVLTDY